MLRDLIPEESRMATDTALRDTKTWPDLAIGLYDRLTGRGAEITYEVEDFELLIPSRASADALPRRRCARRAPRPVADERRPQDPPPRHRRGLNHGRRPRRARTPDDRRRR